MTPRIDNTSLYRKDVQWPVQVGKRPHGYGRVDNNGKWIDAGKRPLSAIRSILIHTTNSPSGNTNYAPEALFLRDSWDVSTHFVVSSHDETIVTVIPTDLTAWHSGDCADNDYENARSIGIEIAWTVGKGDLPQRAIDNTSWLVATLLRDIPTITKIDMHRAQAVPKGRKIDPSGWSNDSFYAWRDRMLTPQPADPFAAWGPLGKPTGAAQGFAIPQCWLANQWLGACRMPEDYTKSDRASLALFANGCIVYDTATRKATAYRA